MKYCSLNFCCYCNWVVWILRAFGNWFMRFPLLTFYIYIYIYMFLFSLFILLLGVSYLLYFAKFSKFCITSLRLTFLQMEELSRNIRELKSILYGNSESEPISEACAQLTQEFFRENTLRLLIICLPKLNLEVTIFSNLIYVAVLYLITWNF